jgi:hypothetical protein
MQVGYDSPEAFEEAIWHAWWPEHYQDDGILPWTAENTNLEFQTFLTEHMQKLIALRRREQPDVQRYVSKNNANIARISLLRRMYPDAVILVPFRQPLDHAASMLRQHENFLARHAADPFARKYMQDIGHFEFGRLHRPILFKAGDATRRAATGGPETLDYWLAYWIEAYEHILVHQEAVILLSFERACADGTATLKLLGERIDPGLARLPETVSGSFRTPTGYPQMEERVQDMQLLNDAEALHRRLLARSQL